MVKTKSAKKLSQELSLTRTRILLIIAVVLGLAVVSLYKDQLQQLLSSFPLRLPKEFGAKVTPTPTPTALKAGKETYTISQSGDTKGPRITRLELDPLEPKQGTIQNIAVVTSFSSPITAVSVTVKTDNKTRTVELSKSSAEGAWSGSWTVDDSLLYTYIMTIVSKSGSATSSVDVAIRSM